MNLKYALPQREELEIRGKLAGEEIKYCVPFDLNERDSFVNGWLVITATRYIAVCDEKFLWEQEIQTGDEYEAVNLPASGALELKRGGTTWQLLRYTPEHLTRYAFVSRILNEMSENEEPKVVSSDDGETKCPKCGRTFLHRTKICPFCFDKRGVAIKIIKVAARQKWHYVAASLLFFVSAAAALSLPILERGAIDGVLKSPATQDSRRLLTYYILGMAGLQIAIHAIGMIRGYLMEFTAATLARDLRKMLYDKVQSLSIGFIETTHPGALMHRINGDTRRIQMFIRQIASQGLNDIILILCACIIMFVYNWRMALLVVVPVPLVVYAISKFGGSISRRFHNQWRKLDKLDSLLNDVLNGIRVVKAFGQEKREVGRFMTDAQSVRDITIKNEKFFFALFPMLRFALGFGSFFVILYGGNMILNTNMTVGELVLFNTYSSYIFNRLQWLSFFPRQLNEAVTSAQRIFEIMDTEPDVTESPKKYKDKIDGDVRLEGVTFGYHSHIPVLKDINIDVARGEMIGLVGHSGSGKSTFINLVMRLYEVDEGRVLIDGIDVRDYPQELYKSQIGVVLQEPFLFAGTILENIKYSKPDASFDEVVQSAKIANAHDFICKLPDGYDTKVGEKGQRLSGGERQRISIARAVLSDPRILILDEATANVDTETEHQIQEALARLVKGRTTFTIAHRLSTLKNASRIMVLQKGKMIELDTHDNLMRKKGIYFGLVQAQLDMHRVDKQPIAIAD